MIRVINIEREYGSGGGAIAKKLADQMGWKLWDHAITERIAKRLRCDVHKVEQREERLDSTYYRLLKSFMRGSYEDRIGTAGLDLLDAESLAHLFEQIVGDIATEGNAVIVGRGASWFLRDRKDVFSAFIYAPEAEKVRRLRAAGVSQNEIDDRLARVDQERAAFVKKYYDMNWPTRHLYHMMINSVVGDDTVLRLISEEISVLNQQLQPQRSQAAS